MQTSDEQVSKCERRNWRRTHSLGKIHERRCTGRFSCGCGPRSTWGPTSSGVPVSLIQDEHLNTAQVEGRAVVQVVDEPAWGGDEDVGRRPQSCFLRLHVQATCRGRAPPGGRVGPRFNSTDRALPRPTQMRGKQLKTRLTKAPPGWILRDVGRDKLSQYNCAKCEKR